MCSCSGGSSRTSGARPDRARPGQFLGGSGVGRVSKKKKNPSKQGNYFVVPFVCLCVRVRFCKEKEEKSRKVAKRRRAVTNLRKEEEKVSDLPRRRTRRSKQQTIRGLLWQKRTTVFDSWLTVSRRTVLFLLSLLTGAGPKAASTNVNRVRSADERTRKSRK